MNKIAFMAAWVDGSFTTEYKNHMCAYFECLWGFQYVFSVDCCNNPIKDLPQHGEMLRERWAFCLRGFFLCCEVSASQTAHQTISYCLFFCFTLPIFLQFSCSSNVSFPCLANWLDLLVPNLESSCVVGIPSYPFLCLKACDCLSKSAMIPVTLCTPSAVFSLQQQ